MAFDLGFNFRSTAIFVTDPATCVPVLGEAYPHTYTAANGYSSNAGWLDTSNLSPYNDNNTNDPRIAGSNYHAADEAGNTFQVDLSSGSAPGAGTYSVDIAVGYQHGFTNAPREFKLYDNATVKIDGTNGTAGYTFPATHYVDATLADVTATTTWTGTPATVAFASTTVKLNAVPQGGVSGTNYTMLAHFRLTLVPPAAPTLGASLLLLGIPFIRAGLGIAYSLAVDPLVLHLNGGAVGLQYTAGPKAYTLAVDPMTLHLNLADVGLTFTAPFAYTLAVDPLTLHLNLADVGLAYSPFTPPRALPSTSGRSPYLEYRRHRRMGR